MSTAPVQVRFHRPNAVAYELAGLPGGARPATHADPWRLPSRPAIDDAWRADAACRGWPIEWWFPGKGIAATRGKAICATCEVREQCLQAALAEEVEGFASGVRGGLNARERWDLLRHRRARTVASLT